MPHDRYEAGQGVHRPDDDSRWLAAHSGVGLQLDEGPASPPARHARAETQHERRRCARAYRLPHEPEGKRRRGSEEAMKATTCMVISLAAVWLLSCSRPSRIAVLVPAPLAKGAALVESSGGKQMAEVGTPLAQPVVVQVNDEQGT